MKAVLHEYQRRAVRWIEEKPRCALLLEMGLGKSLVTLTAIARLREDCEVGKVLVVAPKKVAESTWTDEADKWDHLRGLRVSRVTGTERQRAAALEAEADIYVLGRDSLVWLVRHYGAKMPFDMLVLDELTSFKSNTSLRFKALRLVGRQFARVVGLTGTPAPNGYLDLWAEMFCIDGGQRLGRFVTHYRREYFNTVTSPQGYLLRATLREGAKERIDALLSDICLTMRADDYLSLPDRRDIVRSVRLPAQTLARYRKFERDMVLSISGEEKVTAASAAALMGKLLQFANGAVYTDDHGVEELHREKLEALREIVEGAGSPVLVFYQYRHDLRRIQDALGKGPRVRVYEGEADLRAWNAGGVDVLLAHPASCAYGLNMQAGGHIMVWFGVGFNLELYQQACARLHRQGQRHPVLVYHLLCQGTVDERAWQALQGKATEQNAMMDALKRLVREYR